MNATYDTELTIVMKHKTVDFNTVSVSAARLLAGCWKWELRMVAT